MVGLRLVVVVLVLVAAGLAAGARDGDLDNTSSGSGSSSLTTVARGGDAGGGAAPVLALVGTVDGVLHAMDLATGHPLWRIHTGPLLSGQRQEGDGPVGGGPPTFLHYLPDPSSGQLFFVAPETHELRPVGKTIQELVAESPFTGKDGNVYLGQKRSRIFAVDASSGVLQREYSALYSTPLGPAGGSGRGEGAEGEGEDPSLHPDPDLDPDLDPHSDLDLDVDDGDAAPGVGSGDGGDEGPAVPPQTLLVARTEYTVTVHRTQDGAAPGDGKGKKGEVPFNLTFTEFAAAPQAAKPGFAEQSAAAVTFATVLGTNRLQCIRGTLPGADWEAEFDTPVVSAYLAFPGGLLRRARLQQGAPPLPSAPPTGSDLAAYGGQGGGHHHPAYPGGDDGDGLDSDGAAEAEAERYYQLLSVGSTREGILYATSSVALSSRASAAGQAAHDRFAASPNALAAATPHVDATLEERLQLAYLSSTALALGPRDAVCGGWVEGEAPDLDCLIGMHVLPCSPEDIPQPELPDFPADEPGEMVLQTFLLAGLALLLFIAFQVYFVKTVLFDPKRKPTPATPAAAAAAAEELRLEQQAKRQGVPDLVPDSSDEDADGTRRSPPPPPPALRHRKGKGKGKGKGKEKGLAGGSGPPPPLVPDEAAPEAEAVSGGIRPQVGKLDITPEVLGHGSHGTIIYKGHYEGRDVAVKRMLREYFDIAHREVDLLRVSDDHPNVVRYFCMEEDAEFFYIGLELCVATLVQVVEGPSVSTRGTRHGRYLNMEVVANLDRRTLADGFLRGIAHLHSLNIVHRDVKPNNVLIAEKGGVYRAMISDFGLCAALKDNQSSFNTTQVGTIGWVAPELLRHGRATKAVDIFSAGCVVHYLLHSVHPYGQYFEREVNIRSSKRKITKADPVTDDLILQMLREDAELRPAAAATLHHPYFWAPAKRLQFLNDVSDRIEKEPAESPLVALLERHAIHIVGTDWRTRIGQNLLNDLGKRRKYRWDSVMDLMRAIRNKKHHYQELEPTVKKALGQLPDGFLHYFEKRFPRLLLHAHQMVCQSPCRRERMFRPYFE